MKFLNSINHFHTGFRMALGTAVVLTAIACFPLAALAQQAAPALKIEKPAEQPSPANSSKEKPKAVRNKLSGAELYSMHCNRCHPERYPTERTAAQWKTILMHMRVRANLPGEQARTILKYLQDNSGR
jgi:hypothetical protein